VTGRDQAEVDAMPATECANASLAAMRDLRIVVELLAEQHSDNPAAARFVSSAVEYEGSARAGFTFDEILGLTPRPGCRSWHSIERQKLRSQWLRLAAQRHFTGRSVTEQAAQIAAALNLFIDGDWAGVKSLAAPPAVWRGTAREALFHVLKNNDGGVPSTRTTRRVLSAAQE
jgi:hypothetical protein